MTSLQYTLLATILLLLSSGKSSSQSVSALQKDSIQTQQLKLFLNARIGEDFKAWEVQFRSMLPADLASDVTPVLSDIARVKADLEVSRSRFSSCQSQLSKYLYLPRNIIYGLVPNVPRTYIVITALGHICVSTKELHSVGETLSGYFERMNRVQLLSGAALNLYIEVRNDKTRACEQYRSEVQTGENGLENLKNEIAERVGVFEKNLAKRLSASRTAEFLSVLYAQGSKYFTDELFDEAYALFESVSRITPDYQDIQLLLKQSLYNSARKKLGLLKPNDALLTVEKLIRRYGVYKDAKEIYLQCLRQGAKDANSRGDNIAAYTYFRDALLSSPDKTDDSLVTQQLKNLYQMNEYEINRFVDRGFAMFPPSPPLKISYVPIDDNKTIARIGGNLLSNIYDNIINNDQMFSLLPSAIGEHEKSSIRCFDMVKERVVWKNNSVSATEGILYTSGQVLTYLPTTVYTGAYYGRKDQGFISKLDASDGKIIGSVQTAEEIRTDWSGVVTMLQQPIGQFLTVVQYETRGEVRNAALSFYDLSSGQFKWKLERLPPQLIQRWGSWAFFAKLMSWSPPHEYTHKDGSFFFRFEPSVEHSKNEWEWYVQESIPGWAGRATELSPAEPHPYRIMANKFASKSFALDMISGQVLWQDSILKSRERQEESSDLLLGASDKFLVYSSLMTGRWQKESETIPAKVIVRNVFSGATVLDFDPATLFVTPKSPGGFGVSQTSTKYQFHLSTRPPEWDYRLFDFEPPARRLRPLVDAVLSRDLLFIAVARRKGSDESSRSKQDSFESEMVVVAFSTSTWQEIWRSQTISYKIDPSDVEPFHYRGSRSGEGAIATFPSLLPTVDGIFLSIGDALFLIHNSTINPRIETKDLKSAYEWSN